MLALNAQGHNPICGLHKTTITETEEREKEKEGEEEGRKQWNNATNGSL